MTAVDVLVVAFVTVLAVAGSAFTAAADASVRLLGRGRIRRLAESGARGARALDALAERPGRVSAVHALVSGNAFATVSAAAMWAALRAWPATFPWVHAVAATLLSAIVVFVFGEALPRALAGANPEDTGLAVAPVASRIGLVAFPLAKVLSAPWRWVVSLISDERAPEVPWVEADEARAVEDSADGRVSSEELRDAVSDLGGKIVREVMVPRTDIVALEDTATIEDAVRTVREAGFSRVPVFHDTLDDVRGVLYAKDLLRCVGDASCGRSVTDHMREALFVPETKPVEELLREMRHRTHIALVLDEYGGTAGIVTIEDLVEEIVGEIYDEYDHQVDLITDMGEGRYSLDARLPMDEFNDLLGTAFEVEADTAGGLVSELAGHIPEVGESVEVEGLRITVADREGNRVRRIVIEPATRGSDGEATS